ncbi:MAG: hypothetical protein ACRD00_03400 [Thermoanaerobaculia bacterium]
MSRRLAAAAILLSSACASSTAPPPRALPAADLSRTVRALAAWQEALSRADSLPASRILYDAKFGKGPVRLPGHLAVIAARACLTAKATGPLGGELGSYEDGTFKDKAGDVFFLDPELLRGVLAGVWRGAVPSVEAADDEEALLRFGASGGAAAQARLDLRGSRLRSLRVHGEKGDVTAEFSGAFDPWPEILLLTDEQSGRSLKLRRVALEGIGEGDLESRIACP